ncbi:MAG: DUF3541 domain-containing protein [Pseudomonadales bacterium]|jgi:hypothetical protein|nr:DUF3541 domain-containing protein [Pseudomonadales bacterium]
MKNYSSKITEAYIDHLDQLDPSTKRHFLFRLQLIDPSYQTLFKQTSFDFTKSNLSQIKAFNNNSPELLNETRQRISQLKPYYPHLEKRYQIWHQLPELVCFYDLLVHCFYCRLFELDFHLDPDLVVSRLKLLIDHPEFIRCSSTQAICILYYLRYIGAWPTTYSFSNLTTQFYDLLSQHKNDDVVGIFNYLYGLTHFIICSSDFYQHAPDPTFNIYLPKLATELTQHAKQDQFSLDLKIEAALCFCLYGQTKHDLVIQSMLSNEQNFDEKLQIINNKPHQAPPSYQGCEHTNVLYLMIVAKLALDVQSPDQFML